MGPWKALAALALVLPPTAYVAGALAMEADQPAPRQVIELDEPGAPSPTVPPGQTPAATPDRECDDEEDEVVMPCPEGDDDERAGRDDSDDGERGGSDDGPGSDDGEPGGSDDGPGSYDGDD